MPTVPGVAKPSCDEVGLLPWCVNQQVLRQRRGRPRWRSTPVGGWARKSPPPPPSKPCPSWIAEGDGPPPSLAF